MRAFHRRQMGICFMHALFLAWATPEDWMRLLLPLPERA